MYNFEWMEGEDLSYMNKSRKLTSFPSFHNTSPLTYYPQRHVLSCYHGDPSVPMIPFFRQCLAVMESINRRYQGALSLPATDDPSRVYHAILSSCSGKEHVEPGTKNDLLRHAFISSLNEVTQDLRAIKHLQPVCANIDRLTNLTIAQQHLIVERVSPGFSVWRTMCKIRNQVQRNYVANQCDSTKPLATLFDYDIYLMNKVLFFVKKQGVISMTLLNYDQFLMLVDTVACRVMCRLACLLNDQMGFDELPTHDMLTQVYDWGDKLLLQYGVAAYAVLGEYESLITDLFVNYPGSDPLGLGEPFHESIVNTANEIRGEFGISTQWLNEIGSILIPIRSPNILSELFGIRKHWGNPMLDAKKSGRAVQEKLMERFPLDGPALINLQASFNRMITLEYIRRNGRWPSCEFAMNAHETPLYKSWKDKSTRINEQTNGHRHMDWAMMRFNCNSVMNEYFDQSAYLTDKSVSVYRSHLDSIYVRALHPASKEIECPENRRLLLEFLRVNHPSILDIFKKIMSGDADLEWLCNAAAMKGTEMKHEKARIFAVLPYELRQYFSVTEDMIKELIFKYNPHQTMTLKESDLISKLKGVTNQLSAENTGRELNVIHIIDFSKWNLRMRYDNTCLVFKGMDDFMGTPGLIESSHLLFEAMVNVVQDAFNPPKENVLDSSGDTIWHIHDSGWEGQRQKGWTTVTSCLLSYLEILTGVHSTICGQGDNQVMLSKFPVPAEYLNSQDWIIRDPVTVRALLDEFYDLLEKECLKVGLKVKTAETCRSLSYLNYGKRLYFNGSELSMSLKRISKMMTEPNDSFPTSEARLKTQEGSIYAAGLYSNPGIIHYFIGRVGAYLLLNESLTDNPLIPEGTGGLLRYLNLDVTPRLLGNLLKIPASLGGLPQLLLPSYLCRGHPDPLCSDIVMVLARARIGDVFSQKLLRGAYLGRWFKTEKDDKTSLIYSPYSLNLNTPLSARKPLERAVESAVRGFCKNSDISNLFSISVEAEEQELIKALSSLVPLHPLIANDIFGRSIPGRKKAFLAGFNNATSLGRIVFESEMDPIINVISRQEFVQLQYWLELRRDIEMEPRYSEYPNQSHEITAQELRKKSWGCLIEGVTVPHPIEQFVLIRTDDDQCSQCVVAYQPEHLVVVIHSENLSRIPVIRPRTVQLIRSQGTEPYVGSFVSEGLTSIDIHCDNPNAAWEDAVRLEVLRKWITKPGSSMDNALTKLIESRTDVSLEIVSRAAGRPSRLSYNHRAALMSVVKTCAPCSTTNMFTRYYISSNRMGRFSHGGTNYHMAFGPTYLVMQALLSLQMVANPEPYLHESSQREVYHAHVRTAEIPIVYDGDIELTHNFKTPQSKAPPLLFASRGHMIFSDLVGSTSGGIWVDPSTVSLKDHKLLYGYQLVAHSIVNEIIFKEMMSVAGQDSYPSRLTPISVGDISIIGVEAFICSLASSILLTLPFRVLGAVDRVHFSAMVNSYLNKFSHQFWVSFITPLSVPRLLRQVARLASVIPTHVTQRISGIETPLKLAVCCQATILWEGVREAIVDPSKACPLILCAPSISAARTIVGRYFELCVLCCMRYSSRPISNSISHARDLFMQLHVGEDEVFETAVSLCERDFYLRSSSFAGKSCRIPRVRVHSLRHPWVDRLRDHPGEITAIETPISAPLITHSTHLKTSVITVSLAPSMLTVPSVNCRCPYLGSAGRYQYERFYTPRGLVGKAGYIFYEIILSMKVNIEGVIVLGSRSGSEAAMLSLMTQCKWLYVYHSSALSSYSPHQAASFIPAAFMKEGNISKLISPSACAVSTNELMVDLTPSIIKGQLASHSPTGLLVSSITNSVQASTDLLKLVGRVIDLVKILPSCEWLALRVRVSCVHQLKKIMTLVGSQFSELSVINPTLEGCVENGLVVCGCKRWGAEFTTFSHKLSGGNEICMEVAANTSIDELVMKRLSAQFPVCFHSPRSHLVAVMAGLSIIPLSLSVACHKLLPGWGQEYREVPEPDQVITDLCNLKSGWIEEVESVVMTDARRRGVMRVVRSAIIQLTQADVGEQVYQTLTYVAIADLIINILKLGPRDLTQLTQFLDDMLMRTHTIKLCTTSVEITLNQRSFIRKKSGSLFEFLGHIWKHCPLAITTATVMIYHKLLSEKPTCPLNFPAIARVVFSTYPGTPSHDWSWKVRAFFVTLLMIKTLDTDSVEWFVFSEYDHMLTAENRSLLNLGGFLQGARNDYSSPHVVWIKYASEIITKGMNGVAWCIIPHDLWSLVDRQCEVTASYYIPWSGIVPSLLLIQIKAVRVCEDRTVLYPNLMTPNTRYNESGRLIIGCCCWSCVIEVSVCSTLGVSCSTLDGICCSLEPGSLFNKNNYHLSGF